MPKHFQKSIQDYLSKIKKSPTPPLIHLPSKTLTSSASWILKGCKHSKTLSFSLDPNTNEGHTKGSNEAATLADIDRFLFENFKSLYMKDDDDEDHKKKGDKNDDNEEKTGGFLFESPRFINPPPHLFGSHRFFMTPGSSSSLTEDARTSRTISEDMGSSSTNTATTNESTTRVNTSDEAKQVMAPDDFIALFKYSPSPYDDFRHSMLEMIEARLHYRGKVDWEFMEELLFCYLNLNDKKSYKYVLRAFVDLVIVLRDNSGKVPTRPRPVQSAGDRRK